MKREEFLAKRAARFASSKKVSEAHSIADDMKEDEDSEEEEEEVEEE
jgi:hypothetical protein